jgi:hypothetical protein
MHTEPLYVIEVQVHTAVRHQADDELCDPRGVEQYNSPAPHTDQTAWCSGIPDGTHQEQSHDEEEQRVQYQVAQAWEHHGGGIHGGVEQGYPAERTHGHVPQHEGPEYHRSHNERQHRQYRTDPVAHAHGGTPQGCEHEERCSNDQA